MNQKVKDFYQKIQLDEESKKRIHDEIIKNAESKKPKGNMPAEWRVVAACLLMALAIPTVTYAGVKTIAEVKTIHPFRVSVELPGNQEQERKYVHVETDFGKEYKLEKNTEIIENDNGELVEVPAEQSEYEKGMYSYWHKDGFSAGKDFFYELIYVESGEDRTVNLYDNVNRKEMTVNDHRAVFMTAGTIQGTRYDDKEDLDYVNELYIFYDEYNYIVKFCGMKKLGEKGLVSLAKKISIKEVSKEKADDYVESGVEFGGYRAEEYVEMPKKKAVAPVVKQGEKVNYDGMEFQVIKVSVSDSVKGSRKYMDRENVSKKLYDRKGKLYKYTREKLKTGDGDRKPVKEVTGTEEVQPKWVSITMKVKGKKKTNQMCLPSISFLEKRDGEYYHVYYDGDYNRPSRIEDAFMDLMPCYFRETVGGSSFWIQHLDKGEEKIYHFAYLMDEDFVDRAYLEIGYGPEECSTYIPLNN